VATAPRCCPSATLRRMTEGHRLVDALRQGIERKDADAIAELLHPDVELRLYSSQAPITGREAARAWYAESFRTRLRFEGHAKPELQPDGSMLLRGRVYWFDDRGGRDRPGEWRITFRDRLIASISAQHPTDEAT
jgi:SnoaL-like domain